MADEKSGGFDGLMGKAEEALGKFMDDPEKVDKAKTKAEGMLGKYMDQQQAQQVTDTAEGLLKNFAGGSTEEPTDR